MTEALPAGARPSSRWAPTRTVLVAALALNAAALALAWCDQSWFALSIAIYFAPILNLLIAGTSLALILRFRQRADFPTAWHAALSLLVPAALAGANSALIFAMPSHGC